MGAPIYFTHLGRVVTGYRWVRVVHANGSVSYRLAKVGDVMRVDDKVRKCVCFIGYRVDDTDVVGATAFLVAFDETRRLVVTAKHVIDKIKDLAPGSPVSLWLNPKGDAPMTRHDTDPAHWLPHPSDPTVDAAVLCEPLPVEGFDHLAITREMFLTDEDGATQGIGVGDELYFPGLFIPHRGRERLLPIVRQGTIAAMPEERVATQIGLIEAYLGEVRSIGGLSGSPVFLHFDMWRVVPGGPDDPIPERRGDAFFGLVHGHHDAKSLLTTPIDLEAVNMGISIIVPAQRIREVIEQPQVEQMRDTQSKEAKAVVMDSTFESAEFRSFAPTEDLLSKLLQVPKEEADEVHRGHQE
jgi:hypothetical protein